MSIEKLGTATRQHLTCKHSTSFNNSMGIIMVLSKHLQSLQGVLHPGWQSRLRYLQLLKTIPRQYCAQHSPGFSHLPIIEHEINKFCSLRFLDTSTLWEVFQRCKVNRFIVFMEELPTLPSTSDQWVTTA